MKLNETKTKMQKIHSPNISNRFPKQMNEI